MASREELVERVVLQITFSEADGFSLPATIADRWLAGQIVAGILDALSDSASDGPLALVHLRPAIAQELDRYIAAAAGFGAHYTRESAATAVLQDWARARRVPATHPLILFTPEERTALLAAIRCVQPSAQDIHLESARAKLEKGTTR